MSSSGVFFTRRGNPTPLAFLLMTFLFVYVYKSSTSSTDNTPGVHKHGPEILPRGAVKEHPMEAERHLIEAEDADGGNSKRDVQIEPAGEHPALAHVDEDQPRIARHEKVKERAPVLDYRCESFF